MTTINYKEEYEKYKCKYEEYHSKFWAGYHTNKELTKENRKLMMRLDIYEKIILYGEIKRISHHYDYGILTNSEYGDIFFHSSQCKFNISNILLGKKVKFNLMITKKVDAKNVELILGDISNVFDILETGIYNSDNFQINESSDNTSDDNTSNDNKSDTSEDNISEGNSTNMLLNTGLNNNILPEDNYEEDLKMIHNSRKIWYMNFRTWPHDDKKANENWLNLIDNGFVGTWQKNKVNQKLCQKLVIGDIIAWYIVGMGYSAILRVKDSCSLMNKGDLKIHYPEKSEEDIKIHLEWENRENCRIIKIPVEFLAYTKIDKCIKRIEGWSKEDWTSGFRGPNAISPKHPRWKEQVMEMYKEMK